MRFPILLLAAAAACIAATTSIAATRDVAFQSNATGVCQAPLPLYDAHLRKRPMAVQNEGTGVAFVTCSPVSMQNTPHTNGGHGVFLVNNSAKAVEITCSGVYGGQNGVVAHAVAKTLSLPAQGFNSIYFTVDDGFPANNHLPFNLSCMLPPGTGVTTLYTSFETDVGE